MRKAGGTSLRHLLNAHCRSIPTELEVIEGWSLSENYLTLIKNDFSMICLRNPIDRIKSSYKFEGRWDQHAEIRDQQTAKPFKQWVRAGHSNSRPPYLWICVENYYIKSLIGYPNLGAQGIGEAELNKAMSVLELFNMVLICEELSSKE